MNVNVGQPGASLAALRHVTRACCMGARADHPAACGAPSERLRPGLWYIDVDEAPGTAQHHVGRVHARTFVHAKASQDVGLDLRRVCGKGSRIEPVHVDEDGAPLVPACRDHARGAGSCAAEQARRRDRARRVSTPRRPTRRPCQHRIGCRAVQHHCPRGAHASIGSAAGQCSTHVLTYHG